MPDDATLSNRARYAINALLEIARAQSPVPLHAVADKTGISLSYLEQLVATLRLHKLVDAKLGPKGGYILSKSPADITIADIVIATEDWAPGKKATLTLPFHPQATDIVWSHVSKLVILQLRSITLQDVISGNLD
jgi:Rrf2 family iron-sulfur cluster assembly transcriptional regulator